jgi:hypothetical protein
MNKEALLVSSCHTCVTTNDYFFNLSLSLHKLHNSALVLRSELVYSIIAINPYNIIVNRKTVKFSIDRIARLTTHCCIDHSRS